MRVERPEGFPYTQEEFDELKTFQMLRVLRGEFYSQYSEWCLRGRIGAPIDRVVYALGIFVTPSTTGEHFETGVVEVNATENVTEHWRKIADLTLPKRVKFLEERQYRQFVPIRGELLDMATASTRTELTPVAMIAFIKPSPAAEESTYLICPQLLPPSIALDRVVEYAKEELAKAGA